MSVRNKIMHKASYWIGYLAGKAESGEVNVSIQNEEVAREILGNRKTTEGRDNR